MASDFSIRRMRVVLSAHRLYAALMSQVVVVRLSLRNSIYSSVSDLFSHFIHSLATLFHFFCSYVSINSRQKNVSLQGGPKSKPAYYRNNAVCCYCYLDFLGDKWLKVALVHMWNVLTDVLSLVHTGTKMPPGNKLSPWLDTFVAVAKMLPRRRQTVASVDEPLVYPISARWPRIICIGQLYRLCLLYTSPSPRD